MNFGVLKNYYKKGILIDGFTNLVDIPDFSDELLVEVGGQILPLTPTEQVIEKYKEKLTNELYIESLCKEYDYLTCLKQALEVESYLEVMERNREYKRLEEEILTRYKKCVEDAETAEEYYTNLANEFPVNFWAKNKEYSNATPIITVPGIALYGLALVNYLVHIYFDYEPKDYLAYVESFLTETNCKIELTTNDLNVIIETIEDRLEAIEKEYKGCNKGGRKKQRRSC